MDIEERNRQLFFKVPGQAQLWRDASWVDDPQGKPTGDWVFAHLQSCKSCPPTLHLSTPDMLFPDNTTPCLLPSPRPTATTKRLLPSQRPNPLNILPFPVLTPSLTPSPPSFTLPLCRELPNQSKLPILKLCNRLLARLSRASEAELCAGLLIFQAKVFALNERSGLNTTVSQLEGRGAKAGLWGAGWCFGQECIAFCTLKAHPDVMDHLHDCG